MNVQDLAQIPAILFLVDLEKDAGLRMQSVMHKAYMREQLKKAREQAAKCFFLILSALEPYPLLAKRYMRWFRDTALAVAADTGSCMSKREIDRQKECPFSKWHLLHAAIADQPLPADSLLEYVFKVNSASNQSWMARPLGRKLKRPKFHDSILTT